MEIIDEGKIVYFYKFGVFKVMEFQELYEEKEVKGWFQVKELFEVVEIYEATVEIYDEVDKGAQLEMGSWQQFKKSCKVPAVQFHLELRNRFEALAVPDEDEAMQLGQAHDGEVAKDIFQEVDEVQSFEEVLQEWGWQSWRSWDFLHQLRFKLVGGGSKKGGDETPLRSESLESIDFADGSECSPAAEACACCSTGVSVQLALQSLWSSGGSGLLVQLAFQSLWSSGGCGTGLFVQLALQSLWCPGGCI